MTSHDINRDEKKPPFFIHKNRIKSINSTWKGEQRLDHNAIHYCFIINTDLSHSMLTIALTENMSPT